MGADSVAVTLEDWRPTLMTAKRLKEDTAQLLCRKSPEVLVFYLLDESFFYSRAEDHSLRYPQFDRHGLLHLKGEVHTMSKDSQYEAFQVMQQLLKVGGQRPIIFITPTPMWVVGRCCNMPDHSTNTGTDTWAASIAEKVDEAAKNYKSFFFTKGYRNVTIINNAQIQGEIPTFEIWDDSNGIPGAKFFNRLAQHVVSTSAGAKRKAEEMATNMNKTPKQGSRMPAGNNRPDHEAGGAEGPSRPPALMRGGQGGQRGGFGGRGRGGGAGQYQQFPRPPPRQYYGWH